MTGFNTVAAQSSDLQTLCSWVHIPQNSIRYFSDVFVSSGQNGKTVSVPSDASIIRASINGYINFGIYKFLCDIIK
jgi:hypothetical protein